eukprot:Skav227169  [mRNA]  locus=scaffold502:463861:478016:- [translate_table: standard]
MQRQSLEQQLQLFRNAGFHDAEAVHSAVQSAVQSARQEMQGQLESLRQQLSTTQQQLLAAEAAQDGPRLWAATIRRSLGPSALALWTPCSGATAAAGEPATMGECPGLSPDMGRYRFFQSRCGFDAEKDIRLLADDPSHVPVESLNATRDNMLRGLTWLAFSSSGAAGKAVGAAALPQVSNCHPGDQLFFVFCGHGAQDKRLCECALVPTDCIDGKDCDRASLEVDTAHEQPRLVRDYEVHQALATLPSGVQVTLIVDGCHAGQPLDRTEDHRFAAIGRGHVTRREEPTDRGLRQAAAPPGAPALLRAAELEGASAFARGLEPAEMAPPMTYELQR